MKIIDGKKILTAVLATALNYYALAQPNSAETPGQTKTSSSSVLETSTGNTQKPPPTTSKESPLETRGVNAVAPLAITLQEAIRLALENNNDLKAVETRVRTAEFELRAARSVFDPSIFGETSFGRAARPTVSVLESATGNVRTSVFSNNYSLRGLMPRFGGSYEFQFNIQRNRTDAAFSGLNPQFPSSFAFTFVQPLWRNFHADKNRQRIEIAKRNISLSDAQFRQKAVEIVASVENLYWDLSFALKNLQVRQEAVGQSEAQLESNRRQVKQGVLAPIDIVQAETQVANFKQDLFDAEEKATEVENSLKALILNAYTDDRWSRSLIPVSTPELNIPPIPSVDEALKLALENRTELIGLSKSREIIRFNTRLAREQTKPQVDLIAVYAANGLAGKIETNNGNAIFNSNDAALRERVNQLSNLNNLPPLPAPEIPSPTFPGNLVGGYGQSLGNLFTNRYPTFQVGVRIELPLGNRAARAELGRTMSEETRIDYEIKQAEQNIAAEVRTAIQAIITNKNRCRAAQETRLTAEMQYESERRQFANGISTTFLVLERQTVLINARSREIEAQINVNKAVVNLWRTLGTTLEKNRISVAGGQ